MTTPKQVLVDVADLEALRAKHQAGATVDKPTHDAARAALLRLVAAIPEPEPPALLAAVRAALPATAEYGGKSWEEWAQGVLDALAGIPEPAPEPDPLPPSFVPLLDGDGRPVVRPPKQGEWFEYGGRPHCATVDQDKPRTIYTKAETER